MKKIEIKYDKKKLLTATGLIAAPLLIGTVLVFFTDIITSHKVLGKLKIIFEIVFVLADAYLLYTLYKKRNRFSDSVAVAISNKSVDINEDGHRTTFNWTDITRADVTKKKNGEREIDIMVISDKDKTREINIYPLDKSADEIKSILKEFQ